MTGLLNRGAGERGGRVTVKIPAGVQAGEPERAGAGRVQTAIRPAENGSYLGLRIRTRIQQFEPPLLIGQLARQHRDGVGGLGNCHLSGQSQRERQPRTYLGQRCRRLRVGRHTVTDQAPQQAYRVARWQRA